MKKSPYKEIIDLNKECEDYLLLCKCKSKKYICYTAWEEHIIQCLQKITRQKDFYNFKRYLINKERMISKAPELIAGYIALLIPIYIDNIFVDIPEILLLGFLAILFAFIILQQKSIINESYFLKDILEIMDKIGTESDKVRQ